MSSFDPIYTLSLGDRAISIRLRFPQTAALFCSFCAPGGDSEGAVSVLPSAWEYWEQEIGKVDAHAEFSLFSASASDALLPFGCCLVHGAAFRFRGRGWIICAPPGVGKSTQLRLLQELYPGEFSVICGDRPLLVPTGDGFLVCPTPWNGKENWHGADAAPLAGLFLLSRADRDEISLIRARDAASPVFKSLVSSFETEELVRQAAAFENSLLKSTPVYSFQDHDIPSSTILLHDTLLKHEVNENEV